MSEGSRSWHERVSANTRDYFQGLIACQAQHKAGLRESTSAGAVGGGSGAEQALGEKPGPGFYVGQHWGSAGNSYFLAVCHCCVSKPMSICSGLPKVPLGWVNFLSPLLAFTQHWEWDLVHPSGCARLLQWVSGLEAIIFINIKDLLLFNPYLPFYPKKPQRQESIH